AIFRRSTHSPLSWYCSRIANPLRFCSEFRTKGLRMPRYRRYNPNLEAQLSPVTYMAFASRGPSDVMPQKSMMEDAAQKLKRMRERLGLKYRDVEEATARIASARQSDEFLVSLSRLSDIENKGTMPTMYR